MYDTVILILKKEDIGDKYKWQAILQNIYQTCEYKKVRVAVAIQVVYVFLLQISVLG